MSEKKLEGCSVEEATHIEMGGKVYKFGIRPRSYSGYDSENRVAKNFNSLYIEVCTEVFGWQLIHVDAFPILGIKPLRKAKPEPVEFEATFAHYDGKWHPLHSLDDGVSYQNCKKATFRCVEIVEDEE